MADTFNLDPNLANAFAVSLERAKAATGETKDYITEINSLLAATTKEYQTIEGIVTRLKFDPAFLAAFRNVHGQVQSTGKALKEVVRQSGLSTRSAQAHTKELKIQQQMLKSMRAISKQLADDSKRQARVRAAADEQAAEKEKERTQQKVEEARQQAYLRRQGRAVTDTLAQQAGLGGIIVNKNKGMELSLAGVLKKTIEVANQAEKIQAYNMMAAAQFKEGQAAIGAAATAAGSLRKQFTMSFEEAGGFVTQLTRAGVEASDLQGKTIATKHAIAGQRQLASDMVAVQHVYGRSVETQLSNIMDLRNNFGMYVSDAQKLDVLMSEIGAKIPGLSPEQAVQDIKQMSVGMRLFGANALDAATVYHTLMRDAVEFNRRQAEQDALAAEALAKGGTPAIRPKADTRGLLGDLGTGEGQAGVEALYGMPLEELKSFLMSLTTAPAALQIPQESVLGRYTEGAEGHGPEQWADDFRQAMKNAGAAAPVEFLKLLQTFVDRQVAPNASPAVRRRAIESVLPQFGIDQRSLKRLSGPMAEKAFDEGFFKRLTNALEKNAKELAATDPNKRMNELLAAGKEIANSLVTIEDWLSKKINDVLLVPMNWLRNSIDNLSDLFSGWFDSESEKSMKKKVKDAPAWVQQNIQKLNKSGKESAVNLLDILEGKMSPEQYGQLKKDDPELAKYFKDSAGAKLWVKQQERAAFEKTEEKRLAKKQKEYDKLKAIQDMQREREMKDALEEGEARVAKNKAGAKKAEGLVKKNAAPVDTVEQERGGVAQGVNP